ncbi:sugar binding secreted protein [Gracilibacillus boraciitolerans JCM 21714]|uniref:Sugar binding secreted protein n=1 Tax=Gracilibacillus boraciitolerans JCM 21714 TaxID=1298598 RepID=W4VFP7_9BACI|nr:sugar binding secreted protein [Gracilibacillus boraciitolerans JCM 21714]
MKKWLMLIIFSLVVVSLVACSDDSESTGSDNGGGDDSENTTSDNGEDTSSDSGEKVALDFWIFGSTGYGELVDKYMEENPNVEITINEGEMNDMHNNLFTSISAGSGAPDIAQIEVSQIEKFLGAQDQFYNLNDYGANDVSGNFLIGNGHRLKM